jgi:glycosyltransferase involved in cell wall biosynthesis
MALVLDLVRPNTGIEKYSKSIIKNFTDDAHVYFQSKHRQTSDKVKSQPHFLINTYQSGKDIAWKTFLVLPFWLMMAVYVRTVKKQNTLYVPYFNHWNLFFVILYRLMAGKVIYTVHDGKMHLGEHKKITQMEMDLNIRFANEIIVLSKHVEQEINPALLKNKPVYIIPHGIFEIETIVPLKSASSTPNLLFLGRISQYKGIEMLVDSINKVSPDIYSKLTIAGKSNYPLNIPQNSDKIELLDKWLSEEEIGDLINSSDIMVFPYLEATQSGAITLAIAGCRPILCTNVGGISEQISDTEAVFVKPNEQHLADGLTEIILNTSRRHNMIQALLERKQKLSWETISSKIEDVISLPPNELMN